MALTASEKRRGANEFIRLAWQNPRKTSNLAMPAIQDAFEAAVEQFLRGSTTGTIQSVLGAGSLYNSILTTPFKTIATAAEKDLLLSVAALFEAGLLP